jgi:low affinity Fe/Cu permease
MAPHLAKVPDPAIAASQWKLAFKTAVPASLVLDSTFIQQTHCLKASRLIPQCTVIGVNKWVKIRW